MAHDFGHFLLPDLIFTGSEVSCSVVGQRLYIIFRMLSEAVTMILADVLFVEGLRKVCGQVGRLFLTVFSLSGTHLSLLHWQIHGVEYDWTKRKIHPLLVHAELATGQSLLVPGREGEDGRGGAKGGANGA